MSRYLTVLLCLIISFSVQASEDDNSLNYELSDSIMTLIEAYDRYMDSLDATLSFREEGIVILGDNLATLNVPQGFKYLGPEDAHTVMVDMWGNPPQELGLGMLFPANKGPNDEDTWGIEIEYEDTGHIKDKDARKANYGNLLESMQDDIEDGNALRQSMGYDAIELIGWAAPPRYDEVNKKLYWAKELKFGESDDHVLNYDIRVLGRSGVLILRGIAHIEALNEMQQHIEPVLASVNFTEGNTYADFNPKIDRVAAYGITGLIAGKVLAKAGLFAVIAKFGKFIILGLVGVFVAARKTIFGSKDKT